jgi:hypothetical protein
MTKTSECNVDAAFRRILHLFYVVPIMAVDIVVFMLKRRQVAEVYFCMGLELGDLLQQLHFVVQFT